MKAITFEGCNLFAAAVHEKIVETNERPGPEVCRICKGRNMDKGFCKEKIEGIGVGR